MARVHVLMSLNHVTDAVAQQMSLDLLYQSVALSAAVRAFDDTFYFAALICVPAIAAALLVRNTRSAGEGGSIVVAE